MSDVHTRPLVVYSLVALGVASFSASPILIRFGDAAPAMSLAVWRTIIAVILLVPFAVGRIGTELRAFSTREKILIGASGVFLGLHFLLWFEALYFTSVASASVLVTSSPIFIGIFGYLFLNERLSRFTIVSIAVAVLGAVLIGWGDLQSEQFADAPFGNLLALFAAVFVAVYLLIGRAVRRNVSWLTYVFPLYAVVACTTLVGALIRGVPLWGFDWKIYGVCALMAIGPQLIGHGSFNYALRYVPAVLLGLLTLAEPVIAAVGAYFLFGERPELLALTGMILVLLAIGLAIWDNQTNSGGPEGAT